MWRQSDSALVQSRVFFIMSDENLFGKVRLFRNVIAQRSSKWTAQEMDGDGPPSMRSLLTGTAGTFGVAVFPPPERARRYWYLQICILHWEYVFPWILLGGNYFETKRNFKMRHSKNFPKEVSFSLSLHILYVFAPLGYSQSLCRRSKQVNRALQKKRIFQLT